MKTFYLLRHTDLSGNSGEGVVAEGVVFDSGISVMTWLSEVETITTFKSITDVKRIHGHGGLTEVVIEGTKKHAEKFNKCREMARLKKSIANSEESDSRD